MDPDIFAGILAQMADELVVLDGLDDAVIGVTEQSPVRLVYDYDKLLRLLMLQNDWGPQEALEWYEQNIMGDYGIVCVSLVTG